MCSDSQRLPETLDKCPHQSTRVSWTSIECAAQMIIRQEKTPCPANCSITTPTVVSPTGPNRSGSAEKAVCPSLSGVKPFVMGRKNFLFANTPRGAQSSAVIYSLIETAKENGLDPYRYLKYILETAPRLSKDDSDWAMAMLPDGVPELCRVNTDASMCR